MDNSTFFRTQERLRQRGKRGSLIRRDDGLIENSPEGGEMKVLGPKFVEHLDGTGAVVASGEFYAVSADDTAPDFAYVWSTLADAEAAAEAVEVQA